MGSEEAGREVQFLLTKTRARNKQEFLSQFFLAPPFSGRCVCFSAETTTRCLLWRCRSTRPNFLCVDKEQTVRQNASSRSQLCLQRKAGALWGVWSRCLAERQHWSCWAAPHKRCRVTRGGTDAAGAEQGATPVLAGDELPPVPSIAG